MSLTAPSAVELIDRQTEEGRSKFPWLLAAFLIAAGLAEFGLLALWQRNGYWNFSDGVYAQSAREFLHGLLPYRDFAAAQPPPVYLLGALLLAAHDGLASLRAGLGLVDFATGALVGVSVWRVCGRRRVAVAAAGVTPLLPISLHEHAQLTPETLAAPLLLAGALCCARPRRAAVGGVLVALAAACKLAFVIPALAIAVAAAARRTAMLALLMAASVLAAASLAVFDVGVWREAVAAQLQVGWESPHIAGRLLAQGAWSELVLVIGAASALLVGPPETDTEREPALMRPLTAAAVAGLLLALTVWKRGSYINVLVVAEPPLLVLAACGATWCWQRRGVWRPVVPALGALLAAQSISLLVTPAHPWAATRPGAGSGPAWWMSNAAVDRRVRAARRCPRNVAYSGDPFLAFLANRRMPGDQPDVFMLHNARTDTRFARRASRDRPRCPSK